MMQAGVGMFCPYPAADMHAHGAVDLVAAWQTTLKTVLASDRVCVPSVLIHVQGFLYIGWGRVT